MIKYTLIRSRRKTLALHIIDDGVEVRAPLKVSKTDIDKFVASKEKWIENKLKQSSERTQQRMNFKLNYGSTVTYRGKDCPITARSGDRIGFDHAFWQFYIPPNLTSEYVKDAVIQIYKILAECYLAERLLHFQTVMGVTVTDFHITNAKKRWGSMSSDKSVCFSWMLVMADDDMIDYVVVHELAHITEMNHSARFWSIVEGILPDYRKQRERFKELSRKNATENWTVNPKVAAEEKCVPITMDT
ncbi:MAG: M48 family metallopeptidase, partial [Oscillospiraceae bacterium]|nr:M48 family metallopeptidase [Oscillospiraceae bacterium]